MDKVVTAFLKAVGLCKSMPGITGLICVATLTTIFVVTPDQRTLELFVDYNRPSAVRHME